MSTRQAQRERTREALIEAGLRLAERTGLQGMSINLLVEEAGVSKGSFFHHFGDRASFVQAIHRGFHDRIEAEILSGVEGIAPGRARLLAGSTIYLDACLRDRGVRALLLEARADPAIADEIVARNAANAELCLPDFEALNWPHPAESARIWVGLVAEVALIELAASSGPSPSVRAAVGNFLRS